MPSKNLMFLSVHIHHKTQAGIIFHTFLMDFQTFHVLQLINASFTLSGITHLRPKTDMNMFHMSVTAARCKKGVYWFQLPVDTYSIS